MNNSPTIKKEYSQECISLRCKDTKNYPKSGHWSCKCCCHFSQPSEEKECKHDFGKTGFCSYSNPEPTVEHYDRFTCKKCGFIRTDPSDPLYCQPSEEKDQYGHKIIRPTLPDDTFDGLKKEIEERASEEKEIYDGIVRDMEGNYVRTIPNIVGVTPKQEEWEEKIYDLLSTTEPLGKGFKVVKTDAGTANEIIDLIRQLLKKEREKVIEEVKKNTKDLTKYETEFTCPCGIEHSVQFLIRKPKVMKGKITEITINSEQLKK